jgi:hypothetical protein
VRNEVKPAESVGRCVPRELSVATVAFAVALSGMTLATSARAEDSDEARTHFTAGVNLLKDPARPRYEEAYAEFKKAYALANSPKILGNIGLCAMKLERDAEAIEAYSRYLAEVPDLPPDERAQVERDIATLKATLAVVTVETRPAWATILDTRVVAHGESTTNTYGPITGRTDLRVRRGHHVFKARLDGGREVAWESDINGGESHVFEIPEARPGGAAAATEVKGPRPIPMSVYIAGGATIAFGVTTLITGLLAVDARSRFDTKNDGGDPAEAQDLRDSGTTLNTVSDVFLFGTLIGAGVTTFLYLTRPTVQAPSPAVGTRPPATTSAFLGRGLVVRF